MYLIFSSDHHNKGYSICTKTVVIYDIPKYSTRVSQMRIAKEQISSLKNAKKEEQIFIQTLSIHFKWTLPTC